MKVEGPIHNPAVPSWYDELQEAILTGKFSEGAGKRAGKWQTCACGGVSPFVPVEGPLERPCDTELRSHGYNFGRLVDPSIPQSSDVYDSYPEDVVETLSAGLAASVEDRALAAWVVLEFIEQRAAEVQAETLAAMTPEERRKALRKYGVSA